MIKMGEWRKDKESHYIDRWLLPFAPITKGAKAIDVQWDARGNLTFQVSERSYKWLERHTYPRKPDAASGVDNPFIIKWVFEEL